MTRNQILIAVARRLGTALGGGMVGDTFYRAFDPQPVPRDPVLELTLIVACFVAGFWIPKTSDSVLEAALRRIGFGAAALVFIVLVFIGEPERHVRLFALGSTMLLLLGPTYMGNRRAKPSNPEPYVAKQVESPEALVSSLAAMKESKDESSK